MVGEAIAGLSALKTAFDIAKGLKDIDNATSRNAAVIELQERLLTAQAAQSALLERISQLEREMSRFETWNTEKERYELDKLPPGIFVYSLKKGMEHGEPFHRICSKCYAHQKKSILHSGGKEQGLETFTCRECGSQFVTGKFESMQRDDDDSNYY